MKIATKLSIAIFITIFLFGTINAYVIYKTSTKNIEEQAINDMQENALNAMNMLDRFIYERISDIKIMASGPVIRSGNSTPEEITKRLLEYRNVYGAYVSISFFDANRIRIADTSGIDIGVQHPIPEYYEDVLAGKIKTDMIAESVALKMYTMFFAAPVKDENEKIKGFIMSRVLPGRFYEILEPSSIKQNGQAHVDFIDKNGLLIYSSENKKGMLKDNYAGMDIVKRSMAGEPYGHEIHVDPLTNEKEIYVFAHEQGHLDFKGNDYTLLLHIPVKTAFAPAISLRNRTLMMTGAMMLVALILAIILSRRITKPILALHKATEEFEKGNLKRRVKIETKDEIEQLGHAFNKMAEEHLHFENLRKKHEKNLEKEVAKKTKTLQNQLHQLEMFTKVSVGREQKMIELKKRIKELEEK